MRLLISLAVLAICLGFSTHAVANSCEKRVLNRKLKLDYDIPSEEETMVGHGDYAESALYPGEQFEILVWNIYKSGKAGLWRDLV